MEKTPASATSKVALALAVFNSLVIVGAAVFVLLVNHKMTNLVKKAEDPPQ